MSAGSDDDVVFVGASPPPPPPAAADDPQLHDDLAEAHQLGIDADFVEQLRIMSPRTRSIILTDFRASQRDEGRRAANPRPASDTAGQPPRQRHRGGGGGAGRPAMAAAPAARGGGRGARSVRGYDRHERYEDEYPYDSMSDYDDYESDDGEDDGSGSGGAPGPGGGAFPPLPRGGHGGGHGGFPHAAAHGGDPAMMLQMLLMQSLVGRGGRGGRGGFALPRGMESMLAQARAQADRARAMGADLDVDNMSYEELLALQERVGHVSRGLDAREIDRVSSLCAAPAEPSPDKAAQDADADSCVICMAEFAATRDNDCRRVHVCGHVFHDKCLQRWLKESKKCPICNREAA